MIPKAELYDRANKHHELSLVASFEGMNRDVSEHSAACVVVLVATKQGHKAHIKLHTQQRSKKQECRKD